MKLLSTILLSCISIYAQTTMCFKENHISMATIEATKLNGGECKNLYSLNDMKKKGWSVEDIKITTKNDKYSFIYILKKASKNNPSLLSSSNVNSKQNLSEEELEAKILKKLENKQEKEKKEKELKEKLFAKKHGKELYIKKCASCHGNKGEKRVHHKLHLLRDMKFEDIKFAIAQYTNDSSYGESKKMFMRPYASNTNSTELKKIYEYLKSIN